MWEVGLFAAGFSVVVGVPQFWIHMQDAIVRSHSFHRTEAHFGGMIVNNEGSLSAVNAFGIEIARAMISIYFRFNNPVDSLEKNYI